MAKRTKINEGKPPRPASEPAAHVDVTASSPADTGLGDPAFDADTPAVPTAANGSEGGEAVALASAPAAEAVAAGISSDAGAGPSAADTPSPLEAAGTNPTDTPPSEDREGGAGNPAGPTAEAGTSAEWIAVLDAGKEAAAKVYPRLVAAFEAAEPPFNALRIKARADRGFRRAGLFHPAETVEHGLDTLTPAQVEQLLGEPMLKVELA